MADLIEVKIGGTSVIDSTKGINIPTGKTYNINGSAHTHSTADHALTNAVHAETGLTVGHLLKATSTTAFGFSAGAASDVGLGNVTNNAQIKDPGSSVDEQVLRWDGTSGDTVQACLLTVDDSGSCNIPTGQSYKINGSALTYTDVGAAPTASGVTNGDSHDHNGGDGGTISYNNLSDKPTLGTAAAANLGTGSGDAAYGNHSHSPVISIMYIIDGGGSAITTGVKGFIEVPFACTITGWTIIADQSGSIVVDVWKDTYANAPPTVADTIAGSEKPTLSSAQKNQDLTLTTWTTSIAAGDILAFNVDSITTCTRVTVGIRATRSV
jgi:hypothetical protein